MQINKLRMYVNSKNLRKEVKMSKNPDQYVRIRVRFDLAAVGADFCP